MKKKEQSEDSNKRSWIKIFKRSKAYVWYFFNRKKFFIYVLILLVIIFLTILSRTYTFSSVSTEIFGYLYKLYKNFTFPILLLLLALMFKEDIAKLINRLVNVKYKDIELSLSESINELIENQIKDEGKLKRLYKDGDEKSVVINDIIDEYTDVLENRLNNYENRLINMAFHCVPSSSNQENSVLISWNALSLYINRILLQISDEEEIVINNLPETKQFKELFHKLNLNDNVKKSYDLAYKIKFEVSSGQVKYKNNAYLLAKYIASILSIMTEIDEALKKHGYSIEKYLD